MMLRNACFVGGMRVLGGYTGCSEGVVHREDSEEGAEST